MRDFARRIEPCDFLRGECRPFCQQRRAWGWLGIVDREIQVIAELVWWDATLLQCPRGEHDEACRLAVRTVVPTGHGHDAPVGQMLVVVVERLDGVERVFG